MFKVIIKKIHKLLKENYNIIIFHLINYSGKVKSDARERNRFLIISLSTLFFLDYLLFCYIVDRNPLNIFPSIPLLENKKTINIYLPDIDGNTILKESRDISLPDEKEAYIKSLISKVIVGSSIDNTAAAVPVNIFIRKIWFYQDICVIDVVTTLPKDTRKIISGTEKIFKESLEKTIIENIPSIKKVILSERGIPGRNLWQHNL